METIIPLDNFSECFRNKRAELRMTQIEFYHFLFPDGDKEPENIKKYIGNIENARIKELDIELVTRFCSKCDVSADYLLGLAHDYSNHEIELICNYTGLEENAVKILHKWNTDKNNGADLSKIDEAFYKDEEKEHLMIYAKQTGINFLRIINYLFKPIPKKSSRKIKKDVSYPNLSILHSLYLLCMSQPKSISAHWIMTKELEDVIKNNPYLHDSFINMEIDMNKGICFTDNNNIIYPLDPKFLLEHYGKKQLLNGVEQLIEQVKKETE